MKAGCVTAGLCWVKADQQPKTRIFFFKPLLSVTALDSMVASGKPFNGKANLSQGLFKVYSKQISLQT